MTRDSWLRYLETIARDPFAPAIARQEAIIAFGREGMASQALPALTEVILSDKTPIEIKAVGQQAIDEIRDRRRQTGRSPSEDPLTDALLGLILGVSLHENAKAIIRRWCDASPDAPEKLLVRGRLLFDAGDYLKAYKLLNQRPDVDANTPNVYIAQLLTQTAFEEAVELLELAIPGSSFVREPNVAYESSWINALQARLVIATINPIGTLMLRVPFIRSQLASAYINLGYYDGSKTGSKVRVLEMYQKAAEIDSEYPIYRANVVDALIELKRFAEAEEMLAVIDEILPGHPRLLRRHTYLFIYRGQYQEAIKWIARSIAARLASEDYVTLALILLGLGRYELAERTLKVWYSFSPSEFIRREVADEFERLSPNDLPLNVRSSILMLLRPPSGPMWQRFLAHIMNRPRVCEVRG